MKEEDLTKAIELKKKFDSERELLKFVNSNYVDLKVNLEERCDHGRILNIDYLLGNNIIEGLKSMVIANIEKSINDLQEQLEKL